MSNQDLNCRNDLLVCVYRSDLDRIKFNSRSILEKNQWYLVSYIGFEAMIPSLKGKWLFNSALVYLSKKKTDYTLTTLIPSLCLLARIGYYWPRGGGDREAKPPLLYILTTLRLHYMVKLTFFVKIGIMKNTKRQDFWWTVLNSNQWRLP